MPKRIPKQFSKFAEPHQVIWTWLIGFLEHDQIPAYGNSTVCNKHEVPLKSIDYFIRNIYLC